jgi:hypothetical protein
MSSKFQMHNTFKNWPATMFQEVRSYLSGDQSARLKHFLNVCQGVHFDLDEDDLPLLCSLGCYILVRRFLVLFPNFDITEGFYIACRAKHAHIIRIMLEQRSPSKHANLLNMALRSRSHHIVAICFRNLNLTDLSQHERNWLWHHFCHDNFAAPYVKLLGPAFAISWRESHRPLSVRQSWN